MIIPAYTIREANQAEGKGLFLAADVKRGSVLVAPDRIDRVYTQEAKDAFGVGSAEDDASVRWFENYYTISTDWPDECYINHSFKPTGLWHLGFVFALEDLSAGAELTMDYRLIVGDGERMPFLDRETGEAILGHEWRESLRISHAMLGALLA